MPTGHCAHEARGAIVGREARFQIVSNFDYICRIARDEVVRRLRLSGEHQGFASFYQIK
jgi:hypothetical protein